MSLKESKIAQKYKNQQRSVALYTPTLQDAKIKRFKLGEKGE